MYASEMYVIMPERKIMKINWIKKNLLSSLAIKFDDKGEKEGGNFREKMVHLIVEVKIELDSITKRESN